PHGGCHGDDAGDVVRPTPAVVLLTSAVEDGGDAHTLPHHQRADALGPSELVGRHGGQLCVSCLCHHVDPGACLHVLGVLHGVGRLLCHHAGDVGQRLNGPDLVVGEHHRDDADIGTEDGGQCVEVDYTASVDGHRLAADSLGGVQDGMVLDRAAHDPTG